MRTSKGECASPFGMKVKRECEGKEVQREREKEEHPDERTASQLEAGSSGAHFGFSLSPYSFHHQAPSTVRRP